MDSQIEAILLSAKDAAALLGISRSLFYELHAEGKVPEPVRLGKRVLWRKEELQEWVGANCPDSLEWERMYAEGRTG